MGELWAAARCACITGNRSTCPCCQPVSTLSNLETLKICSSFRLNGTVLDPRSTQPRLRIAYNPSRQSRAPSKHRSCLQRRGHLAKSDGARPVGPPSLLGAAGSLERPGSAWGFFSLQCRGRKGAELARRAVWGLYSPRPCSPPPSSLETEGLGAPTGGDKGENKTGGYDSMVRGL
jgi:hypothetical protein